MTELALPSMGAVVMLIETSEPSLAVQAIPVVGKASPTLLTNPSHGAHFPREGGLNFVATNVKAPPPVSVMQKSPARAVDQLKVTASKLRTAIRTPVFIASSNRVCGTHSGVTAEGAQLGIETCITSSLYVNEEEHMGAEKQRMVPRDGAGNLGAKRHA
jgi:hypothetical protein